MRTKWAHFRKRRHCHCASSDQPPAFIVPAAVLTVPSPMHIPAFLTCRRPNHEKHPGAGRPRGGKERQANISSSTGASQAKFVTHLAELIAREEREGASGPHGRSILGWRKPRRSPTRIPAAARASQRMNLKKIFLRKDSLQIFPFLHAQHMSNGAAICSPRYGQKLSRTRKKSEGIPVRVLLPSWTMAVRESAQ